MKPFKLLLVIMYILTSVTIIWFTSIEGSAKYMAVLIPIFLYASVMKIYQYKQQSE
ncbi:hypothetical protein J2W91_001209 [Paenibacillus amylolyticus]|uniref:Uncharacterized protein n=1 Tax=Paenibacillus amylolyticus TaxID=1451 RepID=A0AAP5GYQ3_PAEAM|nr:hypothetical protein [Paenibacillus amylolyticus]MDR6722757.1 hypothetical protein [Paenibacillus amylolyticus]